MRNAALAAAWLTLAAVFLAPGAWAQGAAKFPSRPITLIMPFTPGSGTDLEARIYQEEFQSLHKTALLMDYKPGASGTIANVALMKAPPDGHTIAWSSATIALVPALRDSIPYDMFKDLAPVTQTTQRTFVLAVRAGFPANTYEEFIAYARANPGKVTWSTVGQGGSQHMTGEWLAAANNIKLTFVHYKGGSAAELDMLSGRIDSAPKNLMSTLLVVKSGKIKLLAIVTGNRTKLFPDLRTVAEINVPGFSYPGWAGIFAPGRTPPALQNQISTMFKQAITTPKAMAHWDTQGNEVVASTPDEFRKFLAVEVARWKKLATDNNIRLGDDND